MSKVIPIENGSIRLPGPTERLTLIGPTGSGKSVASIWHLANANFDARPWIIVNPKCEPHYYKIDGIEEFEMGDKIPKHPGLYMVCPVPGDDMDPFFYGVWEKENVGILNDEALECGKGRGFRAVLTQGRSKRIPMINCTQRPVEVTRFVYSEAQFFQVFDMVDKRDKDTIREFFPSMPEYYQGEHLKDHWTWYYDARKRTTYAMRPVPRLEDSLERIEKKLNRRAISRRI